MEDDPFLELVESARAMLVVGDEVSEGMESTNTMRLGGPSWGWVSSRILKLCKAYPSGVTMAILLSDLYQAWQEKCRVERGWKGKGDIKGIFSGMSSYKKQKQLRTRLSNIVTIDSILERKFVSRDAILEVVIIDVQLLPGTSCYVLTVGDAWSSSFIELYLHRKFYKLIDTEPKILRKGREIRLTGCQLRSGVVGLQSRLLPTEYLVILLDEEEDEDAMLLGAKFCADTFSSIQLGLVDSYANFCFLARLDKVGEVQVQAQHNHIKQQQLILCDDNGDIMPLVLWDDQIFLANLFSEGSMIAVERPFIVEDKCCSIQTVSGFCLEYGSATHLYTVPYVHREEQVLVDSTPNRSMRKTINPADENSTKVDDTQKACLSQIMLPRDSQGSIDFHSFPFQDCSAGACERNWSAYSLIHTKIRNRLSTSQLEKLVYCRANLKLIRNLKKMGQPKQLLVADLRPKMSNMSLYGKVAALFVAEENVSLGQKFVMVIEDQSGKIHVNLHFEHGWSAGEIHLGHAIYISGLTSSDGMNDRLECSWKEKDPLSFIVNLTQLATVLSSPCLRRIQNVCDLSETSFSIQVCKVYLKSLQLEQGSNESTHDSCGYIANHQTDGTYVCSLCHLVCNSVSRTLVLRLTLCDASGDEERDTLCCGSAAATILQASIDDFSNWPEDEQALYLYSLQQEEYLVSLYWGIAPYHESSHLNLNNSTRQWIIGQAAKVSK